MLLPGVDDLVPAFAKQELKVVISGSPSDQQRLSYVFRSSREHREDLQALMAAFNGQSLPLWEPPAVAALSVSPGLPINFERQQE